MYFHGGGTNKQTTENAKVEASLNLRLAESGAKKSGFRSFNLRATPAHIIGSYAQIKDKGSNKPTFCFNMLTWLKCADLRLKRANLSLK